MSDFSQKSGLSQAAQNLDQGIKTTGKGKRLPKAPPKPKRSTLNAARALQSIGGLA